MRITQILLFERKETIPDHSLASGDAIYCIVSLQHLIFTVLYRWVIGEGGRWENRHFFQGFSNLIITMQQQMSILVISKWKQSLGAIRLVEQTQPGPLVKPGKSLNQNCFEVTI